MNKKTKIIATVGPASESEEVLSQLIEMGVNLFRFNLKHNNLDWHKQTIIKAKAIAKSLGKKVGIMVDFQGPEIRIETKGDQDVEVKKGESVFISDKFLENKKNFKTSPASVVKQIKIGNTIFIDDGDFELKVIKKKGDVLEARAERDGIIKDRKSMNVPARDIDLPLLAGKDMQALIRMEELKADYIALSFVRSKQDIEVLRKLLLKIDPKIKIIAKVENARALKNIEEIVKTADGIMVARGDLGIEVPIRELAFWQKTIIDLCRKEHKPVIVATQMLKSMIDNFRPTRAEATDVSNAVFDGTDALMLSEETAIGKYPVRVVEEMANIAIFTENNADVREIKIETKNLTEILAQAAIKIIEENKSLGIKAIVVFTESGNTARIFSRYRLNLPIVAVTDKEETVNELLISYGVSPCFKKFKKKGFKISKNLIKKLTGFGFINNGDNLLLIHGDNWIKSGSNSDISVVTI